jgi:hypothetical protein
MRARIVPERVKEYIRLEFRWLLRVNLLDALETVMPCPRGYFPIEPRAPSYVISKTPDKLPVAPGSPFPVPPKELWLGYGQTPEEYLESGKGDIRTMERLLKAAGTGLASIRRILDFGCGAGRMVRWLEPYASTSEIWGIDISSGHILWCQQYLSPPFHFATTTTIPHLPFEDRYFELIYLAVNSISPSMIGTRWTL